MHDYFFVIYISHNFAQTQPNVVQSHNCMTVTFGSSEYKNKQKQSKSTKINNNQPKSTNMSQDPPRSYNVNQNQPTSTKINKN